MNAKSSWGGGEDLKKPSARKILSGHRAKELDSSEKKARILGLYTK